MALYPFKAADGEEIDLEYPMAKAPKVGKKIRRKGKVFVRQLVFPAPPKIQQPRFFVDVTVPRGSAGADAYKAPGGKMLSPVEHAALPKRARELCQPAFSSWKTVDRFAGRHGLVYDP